ncbi:MAG: hypothetical protein GYA02_03895 [Clostridiaceae bacterium]|nr:hypothetical protein [Clostridiaceae bacterium]
MRRKTPYNMRLAKVAVTCPADSFVVNQTLVLRMKFCAKNRHLRQAQKRYCNELFIFAMVIGVNNLVIVLFITIKSQVDEINSTKM